MAQKKRELLEARIHALHGLVLQHSVAHVRAQVQRTLGDLNFTPDRVEKILAVFKREMLERGGTAEEVEQGMAGVRESMIEIGRGSKEHVEELVGLALVEVAPCLVRAWLTVLGIFASRSGGITWLRLSLLGDDMLPRGDKECDEAFDREFAESPIDGKVARDILREVRASLPKTKKLPDDMTAALSLAWDVVTVP